MPLVHVFASCGRYTSEQAWQHYLMPGSTDDGELAPSQFMLETRLADFEPACIESVMVEMPQTLAALLDGVSYGESWLDQACAQAEGSLFDTQSFVQAPTRNANALVQDAARVQLSNLHGTLLRHGRPPRNFLDHP